MRRNLTSDPALRALADRLPAIVWTAAYDGSITFVSDQWSRYSGGAGRALAAAVHPEERERCTAQWLQAVRAPAPYENEARYCRHDGEYRWFLSRAVPVTDDAGHGVAWLGIMTDIHEHKLAESALRVREERLQLATEAMASFVYDADLCTNRVTCCNGPNGAFGFSLDEIAQEMSWWQSRLHPDDFLRITQTWQALQESGAPGYANEFRFRHRDGHYVDVLDRGRFLRDASGRAVRAVGGSMDISEQRRLERERERLVADLEWERSRMREIFETAPSFFMLTRGADHVFEYGNEAYYRLFGHRELLGRALLEVFPNSRGQPITAVRDRVLHDGIPFAGREMRLEIGSPDGMPNEEIFLDLALVPFTEPDGSRSGVILHGTDVTAHVRARRAAEDATRLRDDVLAAVAHDLRDPLGTIAICAQALLAQEDPTKESVNEIARLLQRATDWMNRLIGDLSDVSSIEAGRLALYLSNIAPTVVLAEAVHLNAVPARVAGVALELETEQGLPAVQADHVRLLQTIGNLVTNALKFTDPGGRITLRAERDPVGVRFTVEDTGAGIAAEFLPHVFDRFWNRPPGGGIRGTGLGLAIVRGIVEAHGGHVFVESTQGKGARFTFTIPASVPSTPTASD